MTEKQKAEERRLNQTALRWKTVAPEGNEAVVESLRQQVFSLSFKLFDKPARKENGHRVENDPAVFLKAFEEAFRNYEPDKGPFCSYLSMLVKKRRVDQLRYDGRHAPGGASLDAPACSPEEGRASTLGDLIPSAESGPEESVIFESRYAELTSLVLNFARNHTGRRANETRRRWYRIFFTEDMTLTYKTYPFSFSHERDIFNAMLLPYLDYYMSSPCRTGREVARAPLKPYGEVVPSRKDGRAETAVPLPADVSLAYLDLCEGTPATAAARSNQLKFYREEVRRIPEC